MAEKKFSQLTAKGATIADTDLVAISESAGGGSYTSKSVTGANIKALVTDANLTTTDITTNNVSTSKHGFAPKAPNDATQFLDGLGAYDTVKDTDLSLSDNTTNNVSTARHGFVPKLPNNTTTFLRGDGTFATPPSGGLTQFVEAETTAAPNATVPVDSLSASGAATNIDVAIVPKGTGAFMLDIPDNTATGGNKRGQYAVDLQTLRSAANQVASGQGSFIAGAYSKATDYVSMAIGESVVSAGYVSVSMGYQASALSDRSISIGTQTTASGFRSLVIGGIGSTASGTYSAVLGGASNICSGDYSVAIGSFCTANRGNNIAMGNNATVQQVGGRHAFSAGSVAVDGDCQKSVFYFRKRTIDATATTLITDNLSPNWLNQVILSNQSAYRFKGTIIGKQSGSTNTSAWDVDGLIVRGANAASTTLVVGNVNLVSNTPAWGTPTLAADTTNGGLQVQVTGAASTNIQWTAVIETTEVIYA